MGLEISFSPLIEYLAADDLHDPTLIPSFLTLACSSVKYGAMTDSALLGRSVTEFE